MNQKFKDEIAEVCEFIFGWVIGIPLVLAVLALVISGFVILAINYPVLFVAALILATIWSEVL